MAITECRIWVSPVNRFTLAARQTVVPVGAPAIGWSALDQLEGVSAMKRLAVLSFTIATLIAPIQVQAQTGCVTFPQPPNPEAELRYLLSHPAARVCPSADHHPYLARETFEMQRENLVRGATNSGWESPRLRPAN